MSEFHSLVPLPPIPDNLTIPQFILSADFSSRPARRPEIPYFIEDDTRRAVTFAEVHQRTYDLANALSIKWGIRDNDVVCLLSPNHTDYPIIIWAVHTLGAIITPGNPSYTVDEVTHMLTTTKATLIVSHSSNLSTALSAARVAGISEDRIVLLDGPSRKNEASGILTVEELILFGSGKPQNYRAQRFEPGEAKTRLAFLSFSSGTTGKPKAVAISHYCVIANVIQMAAHYELMDPKSKKYMNPGEIALAVLPFFHIYGLVVNIHYILYSGMSLVVVPRFSFVEYLKSIVRHRVTHLLVVPPQIVLLCKHPATKEYDLSHVKFCMSGAAPLSGDLMNSLAKTIPNAAIGQGYGLTETCTSIAMMTPGKKYGQVGSAGHLLPGIVARVVKPDGTLAGEGEQGELVVTGPSMALRYYNNAEATKETFVNGWVHTGDEVIIKDREVFVVDRLKEIIKVRGFQVAPAELEGHLLLYPDVEDACVVGVPDEYSGEVPLAFVVLNAKTLRRISDDKVEESVVKTVISKHVSDAKVSYKWLVGGVEFIDAIPKNPSGKILRRLLRDKARAIAAAKAPRLLQAKM